MTLINLPSREDARLCASVVKEIASTKGILRDAAAVGKLTASVAKLFNRGMRDRDQLLSAAMESCSASADRTAPPAQPSE